MTRVGWIVVAVLVAALAAMSVLYAQARSGQGLSAGPTQVAQAPREGPGRSGQMSETERAKMREQRTERMLEQASLTEQEKAAAKKNMEAKDQARQALSDELTNLRRTANKAEPTDTELQNALASYRTAAAQYRKKVEAGDQALAKQLSLKAQVRCMSLGVLENGLGRMGAGGPGGSGRPGGMGGDRRSR